VATEAPLRTTLVDSNVILDIVTGDPVWAEWSGSALAQSLNQGIVVMNPIVYAEVSIGFDRIEDLDRVLPETMIRREPLPYAAGFLAGKAFLLHRRRAGAKSRPMRDFYIGAHAAVAGYRLLTRDAQRYRTYFPALTLITPPTA
jgi:predicted nucleic acid-binding protein